MRPHTSLCVHRCVRMRVHNTRQFFRRSHARVKDHDDRSPAHTHAGKGPRARAPTCTYAHTRALANESSCTCAYASACAQRRYPVYIYTLHGHTCVHGRVHVRERLPLTHSLQWRTCKDTFAHTHTCMCESTSVAAQACTYAHTQQTHIRLT